MEGHWKYGVHNTKTLKTNLANNKSGVTWSMGAYGTKTQKTNPTNIAKKHPQDVTSTKIRPRRGHKGKRNRTTAGSAQKHPKDLPQGEGTYTEKVKEFLILRLKETGE